MFSRDDHTPTFHRPPVTIHLAIDFGGEGADGFDRPLMREK